MLFDVGNCGVCGMCKYFTKYNNIMRNNAINIYENQELSEKFDLLSQLLVQENAKYNLTAIKNEDLILPLHFADCLLGMEYIPEKSTVIDVGCGGGFPYTAQRRLRSCARSN